MPEQTTEPQVWLDHAIYIFRYHPSIAEHCLFVLEPTGIDPIDYGPDSIEPEAAEILATRYPGAKHASPAEFENEHQHRLSGGTRPRHFFYTPDREKVKGSMTPEQLEYVAGLENVAHAAFDLWRLQSDPKQRVNASDYCLSKYFSSSGPVMTRGFVARTVLCWQMPAH